MFRKLLRVTGIVVLSLLVILFTASFVFRGKIIRLVKSEINKKLNATSDFSDVTISFFSRFPRVSLQLDNLSIVGKGQFAGTTLLAAKKIEASVDFWSMIKGENITIYKIQVKSPSIKAIVAKDGKANWDIAIPAEALSPAAKSAPFRLDLQEYAIEDAFVSYDDSSSAMHATIFGLDHTGNGDFTSDAFLLHTVTSSDSVNFSYGALPYLVNTRTSIAAEIEVDNKTSTYRFRNAALLLNELKINANGFFQFLTDSTYAMDIAFNAPSTNFKNILSLVPAVYANDFSKVKTSGEAIINGFVRGNYSPNSMPAYNLDLGIRNGSFKYPDLPKPLEEIQLQMNINNPDGITDHTVIDIKHGHFSIDAAPFDFRVKVLHPVTDLFIDGAAIGGLDLSKVSQFVKLEKGTMLQGLLQANISLQGRLSALEKKQYEQFKASGMLSLKDFFYVAKAYPDGVLLRTTTLNFNPQNVRLSDCIGKYMKTNFSAGGEINNFLSYFLRGEALSGSLNVKADKLNLNDWMGTSNDTSSSSTPFQVPANIRMRIYAEVDDLLYDKLTMQALSGSLELQEETITLNNIKANALDGSMLVNGSYSTRDHRQKPSIMLKYDVNDLDIQKTFYAFNTVQKLMPVGQYLAGKLHSQLTMSGKLGDDMMPDMGSLTGNGNLFLVQGILDKFKPLEKLAEMLNVDQLKKLSLKDVKQFIEFSNGKVLVKPFTVKLNDITMEIGGMHGFDQQLDYMINLKLPRSLMGNKGNELVNNLAQKAMNRGVPLKLNATLNLNVRMTGTLNDPSIKIELREMAGSLADDLKNQAKEYAKAKIDSTRQSVKDTLQAVKNQLVKDAGERLKNELFRAKDSSSIRDTSVTPQKRVESATKNIIKGIFGKRKKITDSVSADH